MILVKRDKGDVNVLICLDRNINKYRFVNITKQHICKCTFNTYEEALKDLDRYKMEGKIKSYEIW